jgi:hypothetical protein
MEKAIQLMIAHSARSRKCIRFKDQPAQTRSTADDVRDGDSTSGGQERDLYLG